MESIKNDRGLQDVVRDFLLGLKLSEDSNFQLRNTPNDQLEEGVLFAYSIDSCTNYHIGINLVLPVFMLDFYRNTIKLSIWKDKVSIIVAATIDFNLDLLEIILIENREKALEVLK